jgi:hypothetical protein
MAEKSAWITSGLPVIREQRLALLILFREYRYARETDAFKA